MRITNNMMFDTSIRNLNANLERLDAAQVQYSTQSKIQVPSDDPVIATRAIKYRDYVADVQQYQKNTSDATSWMEVTDDALQGIADYMTRLKELISNGANDTNSTSSKAAIADEIKEIKKGLVDTMNTSYAGRYVFAGYNTDQPPYKLVTETLSSGAKVDKVLYKGQALSVGGPVSASIPNADILNFCDDTVAKSAPVYNQKGTWNLTANGTEYSVDLSAVTNAGTLQTAIDTAAGAGTFTVGTNGSGYLTLTPGGAVTSYKIGSQSDLGFASSYKTGSTAQDISYHVSNGSEVKVNIEGQNIIGWSGDSVNGGYTAGTNLFDTLDKVLLGLNGESSYKTVDSTGAVQTTSFTSSSKLVSSCLDELDVDLNRITKSQSELGARMNYVDSTDTRLSSNNLTFSKLQSKNEDIDVAQASIEVNSAKSVYEAALSVTSKVTNTSLVDYLR
ncbi:flagellar hook-associated protein FlgL [uncultured Anaeromusa sp.]|uniref:flagellar hook-associated protein FlgL n=1 Tax=uncultured Anaeromusa sp. TaxID=673273 RepID=UPI0029C9159D|nr:flagellar hook-associated protein FlgL [uncultured Anaeromusa sp.]